MAASRASPPRAAAPVDAQQLYEHIAALQVEYDEICAKLDALRPLGQELLRLLRANQQAQQRLDAQHEQAVRELASLQTEASIAAAVKGSEWWSGLCAELAAQRETKMALETELERVASEQNSAPVDFLSLREADRLAAEAAQAVASRVEAAEAALSFRDSELEARRADLEAKRRALQAEGDELLKLQTVLEVGEREAALLRTASAELQVQENAVKHQLAGFERSSDAEEMAVLNQVAETGNLAHVPQLDSLQRQLNHVRKQRQDLEKICDGFGTALGRGSVH